MKLKALAEDEFQIVAVMRGDQCPAEEFILTGEKSTKASRDGLMEMIKVVARVGLDGVPSAWTHEASKRDHIYEFIKGPLRLFFFKGLDKQIAVCTSGTRKSGDKADKALVAKAAKLREAYLHARANNTCEVIDEIE